MPCQSPFTLILRCGKCRCLLQRQQQQQRQQSDVFFLPLSIFLFRIIIIFYVCWISYFCLVALVAVADGGVVVGQLKLQCSLAVGVSRLRQINFARVESPFASGKNASPSRNIINNCKRIPMARARCLYIEVSAAVWVPVCCCCWCPDSTCPHMFVCVVVSARWRKNAEMRLKCAPQKEMQFHRHTDWCPDPLAFAFAFAHAPTVSWVGQFSQWLACDFEIFGRHMRTNKKPTPTYGGRFFKRHLIKND